MLFSSDSPEHGRAQESCSFQAVLPRSHLQSDPAKAQVMKMPAEGSQFGLAKFKDSFVTTGTTVKYFSIRVSEITFATMSSSFIPPVELMSSCRLKQRPGGRQPGAEPMLLTFRVKAHHHSSNSNGRSSCITESNWCLAWSRKAWSCKKTWVHTGYRQ